MSRVFIDEGLVTWEAYASGGRFGLPERPKIVFNCLTEPDRRARYVVHEGDAAGAQEVMTAIDDARLRALLATARELD